MTHRVFSPDAPESPFPLLPLRNGVLFPGQVTTLAVGRPQSLEILKNARPGQTVIGVGVQRDPATTEPGLDDLYKVGVFARIAGITRHQNNSLMLSLQGLSRFELVAFEEHAQTWMVHGEPLREPVRDELEARFLAEALRDQLNKIGGPLGKIAADLQGIETPGRFADRIASALELPVAKAMQVLETTDVLDRLRLVISFVGELSTLNEVRQKIEEEVRKELQKNQREHILREQLKVIKKELGEDPAGDITDTLRERLKKADLPDDVRKVAERELNRLDAMGGAQAESNVSRTYLEWLLDLPWKVRAEVKDDIGAVAQKLDDDHDGLDEVKQRILEHLAVMKVAKNPRGTILCLVGPPGVGKTSLGQSIADATGRPFTRIALGGVRDEAE
ncbi:MAG: LON peptidase substrate-binding domain-containing protein, partial [Myxococcales bacterium]|nr:LON peptidase substrate-binding domain-containing protein [Myxococcales bacterium]